ncbi:phosphotransacetylase [Spiroplasma endosymbiont of 'Nebria riversi']|uniref:phosphotransacetylase n=1 Tax=Spiroplasma endosymbiont of 'Nebria riversi' TaxID=2792084 RepID=UPI001C055931|nr:phosphotransacetylase [Spiroplasma endosymbiont of 'Nebria riversi']
MLQELLEKAKIELQSLDNKRRLIFSEGTNSKIQEVALKLKSDNYIEPILCFENKIDIPKSLLGAGIKTIAIDDSLTDELAQQLFTMRKNKITLEKAHELVQETNYFATMQLKNNNADCLLGGIEYATKNILVPALQIIKTTKDVAIASSANLLVKDNQRYVFTDISLNIDPTTEQLVSITKSAINLAHKLGITSPQVAMLSFSTANSATSDSVIKVQEATKILQKENLDALIEGEMQFDSALLEEVRMKKMPYSKMKGSADIFVFPNLDAGNIGYKIAERLGQYHAVGPMILGLNQVVSDLSRGSTVKDIYLTAILTAWRSI